MLWLLYSFWLYINVIVNITVDPKEAESRLNLSMVIQQSLPWSYFCATDLRCEWPWQDWGARSKLSKESGRKHQTDQTLTWGNLKGRWEIKLKETQVDNGIVNWKSNSENQNTMNKIKFKPDCNSVKTSKSNPNTHIRTVSYNMSSNLSFISIKLAELYCCWFFFCFVKVTYQWWPSWMGLTPKVNQLYLHTITFCKLNSNLCICSWDNLLKAQMNKPMHLRMLCPQWWAIIT